MQKPAKLKHAKVVRVRPGDVVVVSVPDKDYSQEELQKMLEELHKMFPDNKVGISIAAQITVIRGDV